MSKIKYINRHGFSQIVIKTEKHQHINNREVQVIICGQAQCFVNFEIIQSKNTFKLVYNIDGLISLKDFIRMNLMSRKLFASILNGILNGLREIEKFHFSKNLVQYSLEYTMIDPSTWKVYLMYVPIQPYETEGNVRNLFSDIIPYATFDVNEDSSYMPEYISLINEDSNFSIYNLEKFLQNLSNSIANIIVENRCKMCGAKIKELEKICPTCGASLDGKDLNFKDAVANNESVRKIKENDSYSGKYNEDENGNITIFNLAPQDNNSSVWLISLQTGEWIPIFKDIFKFGKMKNECDYISCNSAVSRLHAKISKENGSSFITDLNSTNGTFVNGVKVESGSRKELHHGDIIRFANEEYKFVIK